jgi:hypothetical protein
LVPGVTGILRKSMENKRTRLADIFSSWRDDTADENRTLTWLMSFTRGTTLGNASTDMLIFQQSF